MAAIWLTFFRIVRLDVPQRDIMVVVVGTLYPRLAGWLRCSWDTGGVLYRGQWRAGRCSSDNSSSKNGILIPINSYIPRQPAILEYFGQVQELVFAENSSKRNFTGPRILVSASRHLVQRAFGWICFHVVHRAVHVDFLPLRPAGLTPCTVPSRSCPGRWHQECFYRSEHVASLRLGFACYQVDNLTATLRICREHYYKELWWIRLELAARRDQSAWNQPAILLNGCSQGFSLFFYWFVREILLLETHSFREKKHPSPEGSIPDLSSTLGLRSSFRFVMVVSPMRNMKSFGWRPGNSRDLLFEVWRLGMQKKLQWLTNPCVRSNLFGRVSAEYIDDQFLPKILIGNFYIVWFSNRESACIRSCF